MSRPSQGGQGQRGRGGGGGGGRGGYAQRPPAQAYHADAVPKPNDQVARIENDEATSLASKMQATTIKDDSRMPLRGYQGYGKVGADSIMWTNSFELAMKQDIVFYEYDINMMPEPSGRKRTQLVHLLLSRGQIPQMGNKIASDYKKTLICCSTIPGDQLTHSILYEDENGIQQSQRQATQQGQEISEQSAYYEVTLKLTRENSLKTLFESIDLDEKLPILRALNIILGHRPKTTGIRSTGVKFSLGSNRHFALSKGDREQWDLLGGLIAIRGYFISTRFAGGRPILNMQVKAAAFLKDGPLSVLVDGYLRENEADYQGLESLLSRVRVSVSHLKDKNAQGKEFPRIKTIFGLAHPPVRGNDTEVEYDAAEPNKVKFKISDTPRKTITVAAYFKKTYGVKCDGDVYPTLNVGTSDRPVFIPIEVCTVLPGQPAMKKLSAVQTAEMIKFAVRKPWENAKSIYEKGTSTVELRGGSKANENPVLPTFNITVGNELITVPARTLACPVITYQGSQTSTPRAGSWNLIKVKFHRAGTPLKTWGIMPMQNGPIRGSVAPLQDIVPQFVNKLKELGLSTATPNILAPVRITGETQAKRDEVIRMALKAIPPTAQLLVIVLSQQDTPTYEAIKHAADIGYGLNVVCVVSTKFQKIKGNDVGDPQYFANVGMKINLKLGGVNHIISPQQLDVVGNSATMVVGIDVTHPSPDSGDRAPSVAGMVASINSNLGQWPAILRAQQSGQERVDGDFLSEMLQTRLQLWQKHNAGKLPVNILVYRDGVSEGQYPMVVRNELPALQHACKAVYGKAAAPKITIIVVGKRHNTRFYPTSTQKNCEPNGNPQAGTVVDRQVTELHYLDFFLQSHHAIQGTARPAHYFVVHDDIFATRTNPAKVDDIQRLTYALCHLYGRATKAVSLCPPAYYADLVCERARCYLRDVLNPGPGGSAKREKGARGQMSGQEVAEMDRKVKLNERVKDVMFYI